MDCFGTRVTGEERNRRVQTFKLDRNEKIEFLDINESDQALYERSLLDTHQQIYRVR